jgi:hypothetical protein
MTKMKGITSAWNRRGTPRGSGAALERDRKTTRFHAHHGSTSVSDDGDPSRAPAVQVTLSIAASGFKAARRLVTIIDGKIAVPGGVRALTTHSSGRGNSGALWLGSDIGGRGSFRPRRSVRALGGSVMGASIL